MTEEEKKDLLEHRKWIEEIEHMLEQRSHWKERAKAQDEHWNRQKNYWVGTVIIACFAMVLTAIFAILKIS